MSEADSVGGNSTVFSADHRSVRVASAASEISLAARLENFKISLAFENGLTKLKCGLCHMYFHKDSVKYTIPNHRIFDLQNEWCEKRGTSPKRTGRRYQSASFLYTETSVCTFCSQFFLLLADERRERLRTAESQRRRQSSGGPKLSILTQLQRQNVAQNQRCYQSSEVDGKSSFWAITPPYDVFSRTRREADPWWEIEFGRTCSFEQISFHVTVHVRQNFEVNVFLFDHPVGFDDPFLDHIVTTAIATKVVYFCAQDQKRAEQIIWNIAEENSGNLMKCKGYAIRVQLRGIHILELSHFEARLGDELILQSENDSALSVNSFSSLNPIVLKEELREMLPPEQKLRERTGTASGERPNCNQIHFQSESAVKTLSRRIEVRYDTISEWKSRALEHARLFSEEEVGIIYKVIFKYTSEFNLINNKESNFREYDLLDSALLEHYPRCDLQELHQRIRSVVRWIQSRNHLKMMGSLMQNEHLNILAVNPDEALYQLNSAFRRVEHYWDKKEKYEQMYSFLDRKDSNHIHAKVAEVRGCSWSQFLIIFNLFCVGRCGDIPHLAYNIDNVHVAIPPNISDDLNSTYSYHSGDAQSVGSFSVSLQSQIQKKLKRKANNRSFSSSLQSSTDMNDLAQSSWISNGGGFSQFSPSSSLHLQKSASTSKVLHPENSLTLSVRQESGIVPFDSRFSEYKLSNLSRKISREIIFPKQLSLEFARQLNPRKALIAQGSITLSDDMQQQMDNSQSMIGSNTDDGWDTMSKASNDTSFDGGLTSPSSKGISRSSSYKLPLLVRTTSKLSAMLTDGTLPTEPPPSLKHAAHGMGKSTKSLHGAEPSQMHGGLSRTPSKSGGMGLLQRGSTHRDLLSSLAEGDGNNKHGNATPPPSVHKQQQRIGSPHTVKNAMNLTSRSVANTVSSHDASTRQSSPLIHRNTNIRSSAGIGVKFTIPSPIAKKKEEDSIDYDMDDDASASQTSSPTKKSSKIKHIDFHRVCALCELRLPRDSVPIKVIRKHIITLKSSWDPKLVSQDVRSLDNTISMYNLVYVCLFCAQFFDPDCPGGIAYPVRVEANMYGKKQKMNKDKENVNSEEDLATSVLDSINERKISAPMNPYYDTRYISNNIDVGEVFKRPATVESRKRAQRALRVSRLMLASRGKNLEAVQDEK